MSAEAPIKAASLHAMWQGRLMARFVQPADFQILKVFS